MPYTPLISEEPANVEWDDYQWIAVPAVGGVTQAKRLDQLPSRVAEVVELMTGQVVDPSDVELVIDFPGADMAAAVREARGKIEEAEHEIAERTRAIVLELRDSGVTLRDIAVMVGVSYQRVHQLTASE